VTWIFHTITWDGWFGSGWVPRSRWLGSWNVVGGKPVSMVLGLVIGGIPVRMVLGLATCGMSVSSVWFGYRSDSCDLQALWYSWVNLHDKSCHV
jgi:hypothetical protein